MSGDDELSIEQAAAIRQYHEDCAAKAAFEMFAEKDLELRNQLVEARASARTMLEQQEIDAAIARCDRLLEANYVVRRADDGWVRYEKA
jgi:hypothetical protein